MLEPFRDQFNGGQFTEGRYLELIQRMNRKTRSTVGFRICETPVFLDRGLLDEMVETGRVLTHQLVDDPAYMSASEQTIPAAYRVANENPRPNFMTVDFGLVRDAGGTLRPKLVELQAFPSILGFQDVLASEYVEVYGLDPSLGWHLGGHTEASYWDLLRRTIVADRDPENVVLLEIDPRHQKTLPDFHVHEDRLGIATVDITAVRQEGNRLFYERDGRRIPIERIYNRAIVDELERKQVKPGFDYRADLAVEWAGHPNWFFRISKFSIPYLNHPSVPGAVFLDEWFAGRGHDKLPEGRENLLLKPLYSFAGKGIQFAPTDADLAAIPEQDRHLYLLQERVRFEPVIRTPEGGTQVEIRILYLWPEGEAEMQPAIALARLGRGLMMGVDHNRDQRWVGGAAVLFPNQ